MVGDYLSSGLLDSPLASWFGSMLPPNTAPSDLRAPPPRKNLTAALTEARASLKDPARLDADYHCHRADLPQAGNLCRLLEDTAKLIAAVFCSAAGAVVRNAEMPEGVTAASKGKGKAVQQATGPCERIVGVNEKVHLKTTPTPKAHIFRVKTLYSMWQLSSQSKAVRSVRPDDGFPCAEVCMQSSFYALHSKRLIRTTHNLLKL